MGNLVLTNIFKKNVPHRKLTCNKGYINYTHSSQYKQIIEMINYWLVSGCVVPSLLLAQNKIFCNLSVGLLSADFGLNYLMAVKVCWSPSTPCWSPSTLVSLYAINHAPFLRTTGSPSPFPFCTNSLHFFFPHAPALQFSPIQPPHRIPLQKSDFGLDSLNALRQL